MYLGIGFDTGTRKRYLMAPKELAGDSWRVDEARGARLSYEILSPILGGLKKY